MMDIPELKLKFPKGEMCFGCGKANPSGLKLQFHLVGDKAVAEFQPNERHQFWKGYVQGGLLACLMDEGVGQACLYQNIFGVTAELKVRIKSMARIGEPLIISARVTKKSPRLAETEAEIKRWDGSIVAEATSVQFLAKRVART